VTTKTSLTIAVTFALGLSGALGATAAQAAPGEVLAPTKSGIALPYAGTDAPVIARRGRGADDGPGHVRGGGKRRGRGADDGPNHG